MRLFRLMEQLAGFLNHREVLLSEENAVFLNKKYQELWEKEMVLVEDDIAHINHCMIIDLN